MKPPYHFAFSYNFSAVVCENEFVFFVPLSITSYLTWKIDGDEVRWPARREACAQRSRTKSSLFFCSSKRERDVKKQKEWLSLFNESVVFCMCSFFFFFSLARLDTMLEKFFVLQIKNRVFQSLRPTLPCAFYHGRCTLWAQLTRVYHH